METVVLGLVGQKPLHLLESAAASAEEAILVEERIEISPQRGPTWPGVLRYRPDAEVLRESVERIVANFNAIALLQRGPHREHLVDGDHVCELISLYSPEQSHHLA